MLRKNAAFAVASLLAVAGLARAQCSDPTTIVASPRAAADLVGSSVAIDGTTMLLGVPFDDTSDGTNAGSVRIYMNLFGWFSDGILEEPFGDPNHWFGNSVDLAFPYAVVGAPGTFDSQGTAHFYKRNPANGNWNWLNYVAPSGSNAGDALGASVALSSDGEFAVIGAPLHDHSGDTNSGIAYLYRLDDDQFVYQGILAEPNANYRAPSDDLGRAVAVDGGMAVVGAPRADFDGKTDTGRVNVFMQGITVNWPLQTRLFAPDAAGGEEFGAAVAVSGNTIVVGAPKGDAAIFNQNTGAIYVFRRSGTTVIFVAKLIAPDASENAGFGSKVAIDGNRLVVAAPAAQKAYVFQNVGTDVDPYWALMATYTDPDVTAHNTFADAVDISGGRVLVGDPADSTGGTTLGGVGYLFNVPASGADYCAGATPIAAGQTRQACSIYATMDGQSSCGSQTSNGPSVWFEYTAECTGTIQVETVGSNFDTILSVHSGCPGLTANQIVCNDDISVLDRTSRLSLSTVAGETYYIRVSGYGGASGGVQLTLSPCDPDCPADWNHDGAVDASDITAFLSAWFADRANSTLDADYNHDEAVNASDITSYLSQWFADRAAGC